MSSCWPRAPGKAEAIADAFGPERLPDPRVPASLLAPDAKQLTVLV